MAKTIAVVGASLAGLRAIETLRREGHEGPVVAIGAEPHLPYDRPPLSKQFLEGAWDEDRIELRKDGVEDLDVDWRLGTRAAALDVGRRRVTLEDGGAVDYDALLVATGTVARALPFGAGLSGIHLLRTLDDSRALRRDLDAGPRVVVVGAGFIGMEVAATCRSRGLEVCVVEPLEAPLVRGLGPELGAFVRARHEARGVEIRCGVGVSGFGGTGRVERVLLADGSKIDADVVVVGIGARPATDWLEGSGIEIDDGVVCDAAGATKAPGVFAAGDVARWENPVLGAPTRLEHWTSAVEQGVHAARRLLRGHEVGALEHVPYVWTDQFELRLQIAGHPHPGDDTHVCHGALEEERFVVLFGRAGRLVAAVGQKRPRQLLGFRRMIGDRASFEDAIESAKT